MAHACHPLPQAPPVGAGRGAGARGVDASDTGGGWGCPHAGSTPAAVVQNGCTPHSRRHVATLRTLAGEVQRLGIGSPAILVIGDVVRAAEAMQEGEISVAHPKPLAAIA